jgi:group II intron reverse transcriptase/maturase
VNETKSFEIPKALVYEAYKRVKANKGSAGVDGESLKAFESNLSGNLYKLWNRLSSGSYFPPAVKRVAIKKSDGGERLLGIPTVGDRIAQMVVKLQIEPALDSQFHPDSYGYRPNKSAHQALRHTNQRCKKRAWVLDMDIKGFFDNIDHELLNKALDRHVTEHWHRLYIQRWLTAPVQHPDGRLEYPEKGTPQGGVISPLLANLFLHYTFDRWMQREWANIQFERYADDIVCHCDTEAEATALKHALEQRFQSCGLTLHPDKTKIVYCKGSHHRGHYPTVAFTFLGYTFQPRWIKTRSGRQALYFMAAISRKSAKAIRDKINSWPWKCWYHQELVDIRKHCYSQLKGWMAYFSLFGRGMIRNVLFHFDQRLSRWALRKYKKLTYLIQAARRVNWARKRNRGAFPHW